MSQVSNLPVNSAGLFSYFSIKTYVEGTHWKHSNETLPMSSNNIYIRRHKLINFLLLLTMQIGIIALDKDWKQLGIYQPLFGLIGYFKF